VIGRGELSVVRSTTIHLLFDDSNSIDTNLAINMAGYNCPTNASRFDKERPPAIAALISPYPTVVNVVKLKYMNSFLSDEPKPLKAVSPFSRKIE